jgi:dipeptidyl aminopeptidase/acylaminoacyl peptidase
MRAMPEHPKPADHPHATVPERLFDDPESESRWRRRFTAVRADLPHRARDDADRTWYTSNATGRTEVWCWDVATERHVAATGRPDGTTTATLSADGSTLWWFDDHAGDEFGCWRSQPFGTGPRPDAPPPLPDAPPGYPAGLQVGLRVVVAGFADDDGSRVHLSLDGGPAAVVYRHDEDAWVGALTADETIWVLAHAEHGDARYPALRAISVSDGRLIGELSDAPGKGLDPLAVSPVAGDQRILVGHERRGRDELLLWDPTTGTVTELGLDLPGDLEADFTPDAAALIVLHTHAGRTTVHRYEIGSGSLTTVPTARGVVTTATARPDGAVWYRWTDGATAGRLRVLAADGTDRELFRPPGEPAPGSRALRDLTVDGPGGPVHAFLALPDSGSTAPAPTVFSVHGGPAGADEDAFDPTRAAWLDAGFAVVQVNYRGSTGYGSAWRDALTERIGHTELADIAAVHDHLIAIGVADPARSVIAGYSWGGFLTLLALGTQPDRWAAGVAGIPVADFSTSYEDEMEPLRAYDRALFKGSPQDVPDAYRDSSPLTYVDRVRAPVLVLAGENDPRCPIRQIENYLDALAARGACYAVYRYDAGHGSGVMAERIRQLACEIAFVRDVLAPDAR